MSSSRNELVDMQIPLEEIRSATNEFADEYLIHKGEFVNVYKAKFLQPGRPGDIVVQRLDRAYEKWEDELWKRILNISRFMRDNIVSVAGFCHENIIVYEHVGIKTDLSDPTVNWMERLHTCIHLANGFIFCGIRCHENFGDKDVLATMSDSVLGSKKYFELVYILSLGDLLFQVLCDEKQKAQEPPTTLMAIRHYEKGELEKIIHPALMVHINHKSLSIFSKTAYNCIKHGYKNATEIEEGLQNALKLQMAHEKYLEDIKFQLSHIRSATNDFHGIHHLGEGTFGRVYKAKLNYFDTKSLCVIRDNIVAIKRIFNTEGQGNEGFFRELNILSCCKHPNVVSLIGFCREGSERILVYEYASGQSLSDFLESTEKRAILTWTKRIQICLDIARGLEYLHNNTKDKPRVIHRDIKSDNILLDNKWNAMIADFGLSKFDKVNQQGSIINTDVIAGTQFYLDPEYEKTGKLTKESDIYSFGVVLFELLCGRLAYHETYRNVNAEGLAPIARQCFIDEKLDEMVDDNIKKEANGFDQDSLGIFAAIANRCVAKTRVDRPTIQNIIEELENAKSQSIR